MKKLETDFKIKSEKEDTTSRKLKGKVKKLQRRELRKVAMEW